MPLSPWSVTVTSSLFRIAAFIFLRIISVRAGKKILPVLYLTYLVSALSGPSYPSPKLRSEAKSSVDEKTVKSERPEPRAVIKTCNLIATLVFSLPTFSKRLRRISFFINTLLLVFALDLVLHPLFYPARDVIFTRIGAVDPDGVKVVVRYPQFNATEGSVKVVYRPTTSAAVEENRWMDGPVLHLTLGNDWVNTGRIIGLWPSTSYEYRLAWANSTLDLLPYPTSPLRFRTFPDPRLSIGSHFRFIVTSCTMPNFPYFPGQGDRIRGFDLLADYIWPMTSTKDSVSDVLPGNAGEQGFVPEKGPSVDETASMMGQGPTQPPELSITGPSAVTTHADTTSISRSGLTLSPSPINSSLPSVTPVPAPFPHTSTAATEFMLFLGDFIYADVPYYHGDDKEAYRRLYRRNYASNSFRKVYERLPIFHIYDDHDIINNFVGLDNDSTAPFPNAASAFDIYNAQANYDPKVEGQYYYDFRHGDIAFFVMDTRRYRSNVTDGEVETRTMLGDKQVAALHAWLAQVNQTTTFKFIISSVPFTSLWGHDAVTDSWAGYSTEKDSILTAIHSVPNVLILTGDRHEFAAIEFNAPSASSHSVLEFSTSPLSMFYIPFFRTLKKESERHVERRVKETIIDAERVEQVLEKIELVPEERVLKYIATGNHKWSSFEIDTRNSQKPAVHVEVMVDGRPAYRLSIAGTPVNLRTSTALGAFIPQSFKGMLGKIGLQPSKWF